MDQQEIGELYSSSSGRLKRIVRAGVAGPEVVIEDACQVAWSRLLRHRERVRRDTALGWLTKTAIREAVRVSRRRASELPLANETGDPRDAVIRGLAAAPPDLVEQREALGAISALPVRQQRALWLIGLGLSYREMATHEACTQRTIERQVMTGRRNLRELVAE